MSFFDIGAPEPEDAPAKQIEREMQHECARCGSREALVSKRYGEFLCPSCAETERKRRKKNKELSRGSAGDNDDRLKRMTARIDSLERVVAKLQGNHGGARGMKVPEFGELLNFAASHYDDDPELASFFDHSAPSTLYMAKHGKKRGGGGWSGAIKNTLAALRKMARMKNGR